MDNKEDWLKVSVKWTTAADGRKIPEPHIVAEANNVSYLVLSKISNPQNNLYSCNVFSKFGLEDRKILQVIFSGNTEKETTSITASMLPLLRSI